MYKELVQAFYGKRIWNRIQKKFEADKYILMPHEEDEYNMFALQYLEAYLKKEKAKKAIIFTFDEAVLKQCITYNGNYDVKVFQMSKENMNALLQFYALYEFSKKITIISLTKPYDTCGENLLGVHGVTKRELLCYDIYRFSEIPKMEGMVWE